MKTEKTSGQLRELFRVAYVENQDQAVKTHELDRFLNPCITMRTVKKGEDIVRPTDKLQSIIMVVKGGAHFTRVSTDGNTNMLAAVNAPFLLGSRSWYQTIRSTIPRSLLQKTVCSFTLTATTF